MVVDEWSSRIEAVNVKVLVSIGFSHTRDWVRMRTIIIVQEVEVHGWLLSGSEEDYTLLLFFDSCS